MSPAPRDDRDHSALAGGRMPRMGDGMSHPDQTPQKPGFIGENPQWGFNTLVCFAIVGAVLTGIILFFR
jgi:hypothetical protein